MQPLLRCGSAGVTFEPRAGPDGMILTVRVAADADKKPKLALVASRR